MSKALHHAWHQIANNDQIADSYTKALDRNRRIENHSRVRVSDLAKRKETGSTAVKVARAASLKV